jgi:hypothetical protein
LKVVLSDGRAETGRLADWNEERIGLEGDHGEQRAVLRESIAKATIEVEF